MKIIMAALAAFLLVVVAQPAQARHHRHHHYTRHHTVELSAKALSGDCRMTNDGRTICSGASVLAAVSTEEQLRYHHHGNPIDADNGNCPRYLGCGCHLANHYHLTGRTWRNAWVARFWASLGSPANPGCTNCVAVLSRGGGGHVGIVQGYDNGNPIIYSYANGRLGWTTAVYPSSRVLAYRQI